MKIDLTKRHLDSLRRSPPERDTVLWDAKKQGFGIRATPAGAISFIVQYRNAQGHSRRLTIGSYGRYTLDQAKRAATEMLGAAQAARDGRAVDPAEGRHELRTAVTFRQLADEYMENAEAGKIKVRRGLEDKPKKPGTIATDRYRVKHLTAFFRDKVVKSIARADCEGCRDSLVAGKHGAARTYGLLGAILSYAVSKGYIASNPAHGVRRPADGKRAFRLEADGYRALGKALEAADQQGESWQGIGAIRLLALTGCRKGEILSLRLDEIDVQGRCLRLGDTKTGKSIRPLGEPALRLLKALASRPGRPQSDYLLPGRDPRNPFVALDGVWQRIVGTEYTPHCLRHAFAGACDDLALSELTIATLLGHASARTGSTTRGYISKSDAVLLAAADGAGRYIWQAMTGEPLGAEIIELRGAVG